jgi:hypothetical protein
MIRTKRIESSAPDSSVSVLRWDDETGEAVKVVYDVSGRRVSRAVVRRFPRDQWQDDVVGETTWFDDEDRVVRRTPVLLGRSLAL